MPNTPGTPQERGVSVRALGAGSAIAALLGVAAPYENLLISGSPLHFDYSTPAAVFFFFFLAWLTKVVVLRYGGVRWYRRTRPFFLGMILGHYVTGGLWIVIDGFTGMTGNQLFYW